MAATVKSTARKRAQRRYRITSATKAAAVEEDGLLAEIGTLRGQVEHIGERLADLEVLHLVRQRDAARADWSPGRGISWEELRAKGRAILTKHGR